MKIQTVNAIHSLITIHNHRRTGYEIAAIKTRYQDLRELFSHISQQSRLFTDELNKCISHKVEVPGNGSVRADSVDEDYALLGENRFNALSSAEFREDSAKRSYEEILQKKEEIPA